jgi:hypothetical protein
MRYSRLTVLTILLVISCVDAQAQTPAAAKKYFQQGAKNFAEGNLGVAFENYSRAIEISLRLDSRKSDPLDRLKANNLATSSEAERVTVIDPFTAIAYTNRGIVRHQQNDFDGRSPISMPRFASTPDWQRLTSHAESLIESKKNVKKRSQISIERSQSTVTWPRRMLIVLNCVWILGISMRCSRTSILR